MFHPVLLFRRSIKTHLNLIFSLLMYLTFILIFVYLFYESYREHAPVSAHFFKKWLVMLIFFSIIISIAAVFGVKELWKLVKSTARIKLDVDSLSIGKKTVLFTDIKDLKTVNLTYISFDKLSGATLTLKNEETIFIPGERHYKRDHELFKALEQRTPSAFPDEGEENSLLLNTEEKNLEPKQEGYYGFNILKSVDHLLLFSLLIITLSGMFKYLHSPLALVFLASVLLVYFLMADMSYCYDIDEFRLTIKNKMLFGYARVYDLEEIQKAVIYSKGSARNSRNGIRIVTIDYHSTFFSNNGFRLKKWAKVAETLRSNGVQVINEFEGST